jgi:hypothetical protein
LGGRGAPLGHHVSWMRFLWFLCPSMQWTGPYLIRHNHFLPIHPTIWRYTVSIITVSSNDQLS